jgi:hypothetical protein
MCDYSLCGLPNRLAVDGEDLVVHKFPTLSMGLASPTDLQVQQPVKEPVSDRSLWTRIKHLFEPDAEPAVPVAVCIPPGARLILKGIPADMQSRYHIQAEESVVFVQTSANPNTYRDAIQFHSGRQVLLQDLREGMGIEVLSLAGAFLGDEPEFAGSVHRNVER